uniref:Uncharacterized protein n=1 Tax=Vespula pensylvanica TaxID=30213 RepID=A0A834PA48_VESPE|nr:hypothetical protein H0235_002586 [Vespula pensylvanica]
MGHAPRGSFDHVRVPGQQPPSGASPILEPCRRLTSSFERLSSHSRSRAHSMLIPANSASIAAKESPLSLSLLPLNSLPKLVSHVSPIGLTVPRSNVPDC